jgi:hypothetical protein
MLLANLTKINIDNDPDMFSADGVAPLPPLPMAESGGSQSNQYLIDWGEQDLKSPKFGGFRGLEDFSIYYEIFRQQHLNKGGY